MTESTDSIVSVSLPYHRDSTDESRIVFVGDCAPRDILADSVIGNDITDVLTAAEVAVVNLEATIQDGEPISKNGPKLSIPRDTPSVLSGAGFDVACLANNHAMDYGYESVQRTTHECNDAGLRIVGVGDAYEDAIKPLRLNVAGDNLALFNVCQREFGTATRRTAGTAWIGTPGLVQRVMEAAMSVEVVVVVVHGGNEYVPLPAPAWQDRLRELADAGADLVVGHHPHVMQGWESYDGTPIVYSLGNFLAPTGSHPGSTWGGLLECAAKDGSLTDIKIRLIRNHGRRATALTDEAEIKRHRQYLRMATEITGRFDSNPGYWQEIACTLYDKKYKPLLDRFGGGHVRTALNNPTIELDRLRRGVIDSRSIADADRRKLLNYIRAEAHSEALTTALNVHTGVSDDHRSEETKETINELWNHVH